jgi:hypothetical protein
MALASTRPLAPLLKSSAAGREFLALAGTSTMAGRRTARPLSELLPKGLGGVSVFWGGGQP